MASAKRTMQQREGRAERRAVVVSWLGGDWELLTPPARAQRSIGLTALHPALPGLPGPLGGSPVQQLELSAANRQPSLNEKSGS